MIHRLPLWCRRLDKRGATIVEFAMVAPVMGLTLLGAFDIAHTLYMRAVLQGIVQKTARDSALETGTEQGNAAKLDGRVRDAALLLANNADVQFSRRFYRTFSQAAAAQAEPFPGPNDNNGDGICNNGEVFTDINRNGVRDMDGADDGQGGAKDRTLYTVTVTYPRMFPLFNFIGGSDQTVVQAKTILVNQPYGDQAVYDAPIDGHCP